MNSSHFVEELRRIISHFWDSLLEIAPKLILGVFVLLLGYLVARLMRLLVVRTIDYLSRTINNRLKSQLLQVNFGSSKTYIGKTVYWIVILLFVTLFTEIIGLPIITSWLKGLGEYLPNILAGVVIIFFGIIFGRLLSELVKSGAQKAGLPNSLALGKASRYIILAITIIIAIDQIGFDITFLTQFIYIVLGALLVGGALAFALGAKTSVSNILASYYVNRTYKEGNEVRIGEYKGTIQKITPTSVIIKTDRGEVIIPSKLFSEKESIKIEKNA